jgi:hypothetical protein
MTTTPIDAEAGDSPSTERPLSAWPLPLLVAFRYCVAFVAVTTTYLAVGHVQALLEPVAPFVVPIAEWIQYGPAGLMTGYEWVTAHLFGADVPYPTIAGYRAYLITALALAGVITLVWSAIDRRRRDYRRAHAWFRVYLRYLLAAVMLTYGMAKVIPLQFPQPSLVQLITPVGELTRMRLLWLSMGAAPAYQVFTGLCEVTGALLLLSRRTSLLGALILAGSLTNVLALNLAYGIGVQLNVTVYLLMALILVAPDARQLTGTLFQPAGSAVPSPAPAGAWRGMTRATAAVKWLVVIWLIGVHVRQPWVMSADEWRIPALYGIYDVEEFVRAGVAVAKDDDARWQRVVIAERETAAIQSATGSLQRYSFRVDALAHTLTLTPAQDKGEPLTLRYSQEADGRLIVDGNIRGDAVKARLHAADLTKFTLRQPLR